MKRRFEIRITWQFEIWTVPYYTSGQYYPNLGACIGRLKSGYESLMCLSPGAVIVVMVHITLVGRIWEVSPTIYSQITVSNTPSLLGLSWKKGSTGREAGLQTWATWLYWRRWWRSERKHQVTFPQSPHFLASFFLKLKSLNSSYWKVVI